MSIFKLRFLQNYQPNHFGKHRNWNFSTFGVILSEKTIIFSFLHLTSDGLEMPDLCVIWAQFGFGTRVWPNQLAWFLPSTSRSKACYLFWNFPLKRNCFFRAVVSWWTRNARNAIRLVMPRYWKSYFFNSTCFVFFHQIVKPYPFTWGGLFVFKYHEEYSLCRNRSPYWPKVAKVLLVLGSLDIPTRPSPELQIWILVSRSELTMIYF